MSKVDKSIGLQCKLQGVLLRLSLLTIYKAFIKPHLDYWDIIYEQAYKKEQNLHLLLIKKYDPTLGITLS